MLGQLVPCGGGRPLALFKAKLVVGRHSACDVVLPSATVSARHCELEFKDGYWHVCDLGSKNGISVNGAVCASRQLLPNDILAVAGHRYTLIYNLADTVPFPVQPARPIEKTEVSLRKPASSPALPSAAAPLGRLIPCGGGDPIPLRQATVIVGRYDRCDVVLRSATVSGRHCQLDWTDQGWYVRDLGSRNGIRVAGVRCEEKLLPPGCVLSIADQRYEVVYGHAAAGPAPRLFAQSLLEAAKLVPERPDSPSQP
jgi:pSer/pThr/pTyr-binding forkhead associated (FHA) protein